MNSKVIVITGASSGIGFETALEAALAGFTVVATMRDVEKGKSLTEAAAKKGVSITIEALDVQNQSSIDNCFASVIRRFGRIDVLLNNAGFGMAQFLEQSSEKEIQEVFDVNTFGVMRCFRAVLPYMKSQKSGHIVTVTSVGGLVGQPMNEIYCSAKFAVEGFVESMATYLEPYFGITCSLIEPGATNSDFVKRVFRDLDKKGGLPSEGIYGQIAQDYLASYSASWHMPRAQEAAEVAEFIVQALESSEPKFRNLTSDFATEFCREKLAGDPTGHAQIARIRRDLLQK